MCLQVHPCSAHSLAERRGRGRGRASGWKLGLSINCLQEVGDLKKWLNFMDDTALSHTIHNGLRIIIPIFSLLISSPKRVL